MNLGDLLSGAQAAVAGAVVIIDGFVTDDLRPAVVDASFSFGGGGVCEFFLSVDCRFGSPLSSVRFYRRVGVKEVCVCKLLVGGKDHPA